MNIKEIDQWQTWEFEEIFVSFRVSRQFYRNSYNVNTQNVTTFSYSEITKGGDLIFTYLKKVDFLTLSLYLKVYSMFTVQPWYDQLEEY